MAVFGETTSRGCAFSTFREYFGARPCSFICRWNGVDSGVLTCLRGTRCVHNVNGMYYSLFNGKTRHVIDL